ncbi:hypothetical protein O3301_28200 [Janthinobacterium sp. SUN211]|uniref:hypothetical protein n=1 Tax=Janthinobacterium sp. SUN211 TaxID=3014786 RepID=UPI002712B2DD|nr:hypothetical protein [Janthinobacterium sp. SUN211]MDO8052356.1 hypothetical protein [Janthinobacterium sp. SUN211]
MNEYKEFCRLRDYRKPGAEICQHTEAEAFALATAHMLGREPAHQTLYALPTTARPAANPNDDKTTTWSKN